MTDMKSGASSFVQRHSGCGHAVTWRDDHFGECACGACYYSAAGVTADQSGRIVAPAQRAPAPRPDGPHDGNCDAREPVK